MEHPPPRARTLSCSKDIYFLNNLFMRKGHIEVIRKFGDLTLGSYIHGVEKYEKPQLICGLMIVCITK